MTTKLKKTEMKTKRLGNSDLAITPIGFGAWAIGGSGWEFGWGEQDDKRPYVFTKCGLRWDEQGYVHRSLQARPVRRECEDMSM